MCIRHNELFADWFICGAVNIKLNYTPGRGIGNCAFYPKVKFARRPKWRGGLCAIGGNSQRFCPSAVGEEGFYSVAHQFSGASSPRDLVTKSCGSTRSSSVPLAERSSVTLPLPWITPCVSFCASAFSRHESKASFHQRNSVRFCSRAERKTSQGRPPLQFIDKLDCLSQINRPLSSFNWLVFTKLLSGARSLSLSSTQI